MRRHFYVDYDRLKEDWARYVQEIKSFLAHEKTHDEIPPIEAKKEPLEAKISHLAACSTHAQPGKSSTRKEPFREVICTLSSRQVKYLKQCADERPYISNVRSFFYAHHSSLYFSIRLFRGIAYSVGCSAESASLRTSSGVLQ